MFKFTETEDSTKLWNNLRESISLMKSDEIMSPGQGTFAHIIGGYDSNYYGCVPPVQLRHIMLIMISQLHVRSGLRKGHVYRVQE